jgi:hypothetical protein
MVAGIRKPTRYRLLFAALAVGLRPGPSTTSSKREPPRQEQFFGRPFPFLIRCRGVLLPCAVVEGEDAARSARRDLEARAVAALN